MYTIELTYKKSREAALEFLAEHKEFVADGYAKDHFLHSGPKTTKDGGVIIANFDSLQSCEEFIKLDPFYYKNISEFKVIEFTSSN